MDIALPLTASAYRNHPYSLTPSIGVQESTNFQPHFGKAGKGKKGEI